MNWRQNIKWEYREKNGIYFENDCKLVPIPFFPQSLALLLLPLSTLIFLLLLFLGARCCWQFVSPVFLVISTEFGLNFYVRDIIFIPFLFHLLSIWNAREMVFHSTFVNQKYILNHRNELFNLYVIKSIWGKKLHHINNNNYGRIFMLIKQIKNDKQSNTAKEQKMITKRM